MKISRGKKSAGKKIGGKKFRRTARQKIAHKQQTTENTYICCVSRYVLVRTYNNCLLNIPNGHKIYQTATKYTKRPQNIPNGHKIYQTATKYTKRPQNIQNCHRICHMTICVVRFLWYPPLKSSSLTLLPCLFHPSQDWTVRSSHLDKQGCQIFLATSYKNG
jgi:hypothetical protein